MIKRLFTWLFGLDKVKDQVMKPIQYNDLVYPDLQGLDKNQFISGASIGDEIANDMFDKGYGMYILRYIPKDQKHRILIMYNVQDKNF